MKALKIAAIIGFASMLILALVAPIFKIAIHVGVRTPDGRWPVDGTLLGDYAIACDLLLTYAVIVGLIWPIAWASRYFIERIRRRVDE